MMSKKIVLTGGGTAGHVTPNLALIPELKKEGYDIWANSAYRDHERQQRLWDYYLKQYGILR